MELSNYFSAYYANLLESLTQFRLTLKSKDGKLRQIISGEDVILERVLEEN